jgi:hypothetical protein
VRRSTVIILADVVLTAEAPGMKKNTMAKEVAILGRSHIGMKILKSIEGEGQMMRVVLMIDIETESIIAVVLVL